MKKSNNAEGIEWKVKDSFHPCQSPIPTPSGTINISYVSRAFMNRLANIYLLFYKNKQEIIPYILFTKLHFNMSYINYLSKSTHI